MVSDNKDEMIKNVKAVLILVLMEYGLWLFVFRWRMLSGNVLILVLMEYGLWLKMWVYSEHKFMS